MSFETDRPDLLRVEELAYGITAHLSRRFDLSFTYFVNPLQQEYGSDAALTPWLEPPRPLGYKILLLAAPHESVRENPRSVPIGSVQFGESPLVLITQKQLRDETKKFLTRRLFE